MSEYLQENRRAVIALVVVLCAAALGGLYLVLASGGGEEPLPPVSQGQQPQPLVTVEPVDQSDPIVANVVTRGTGEDPFGPLPGEEDDAESSAESDDDSDAAKPATGTTSRSTKTSAEPGSTVVPSTGRTDPVEGADTGDPGSSKAEEKNVPPTPIESGKDADSAVTIALVELQDEYAIARVDGDRTKLYIAVPGLEGVTYVAPLGGGCAWMGRTGTEVRVSVCQGEPQQL
jgi:hypothetical protein